jgi:hypothetical protein
MVQIGFLSTCGKATGWSVDVRVSRSYTFNGRITH